MWQGFLRVVFSRSLYLLARLGIGAMFLYAGVAKLSAPADFAALISRYGLVPESLLVLVAIGLPLLELIAGIGVLWGRREGYCLAAGLMLLFLFVLWFGILHDLNIDCGCFSVAELDEHGGLRAAFYRDWVLLGLVLYLMFWKHARTQWRAHYGLIKVQEEEGKV